MSTIVPAENIAECSDDETNRIGKNSSNCSNIVETLTPTMGIDYEDNETRLQEMADAFRTILRVRTYFCEITDSVLEKTPKEKGCVKLP